jgi:hypothetical protein
MTGDIIRYAFSGGLRERLLERNRFRCRGCGKRSALVVHHRDRCNRADLLVTLCIRCHLRIHHSSGLRYWFYINAGKIMGRTWSAIDRTNAYVEAGADAVFLTGALSVADMARVGREVKPPRNMAMPFGYISKSLTPAQVREMGFDFTSIASFVPAEAYAMLKYLEAGLADGAKAERKLHAMVKDSPVADWGKFSCFGEFREVERKYISAEEIAALPSAYSAFTPSPIETAAE